MTNEGARDRGFCKLFKRTLGITSKKEGWIFSQVRAKRLRQLMGFVKVGMHDIIFIPMYCPNGKRAGTGQRSSLTQGSIACGCLSIESLADLFGDLFEFVHIESYKLTDANI